MIDLTIVDNGNIAKKIARHLGGSDEVRIKSISDLDTAEHICTDVLLLSRAAAKRPAPLDASCSILLVAGGCESREVAASCVVSYGMSPRDTITLSSISEVECALALQRELPTADGRIIERQELMIRREGLEPEEIMAVVGAALIVGSQEDSLTSPSETYNVNT